MPRIEMAKLKEEMKALQEQYPELAESVIRIGARQRLNLMLAKLSLIRKRLPPLLLNAPKKKQKRHLSMLFTMRRWIQMVRMLITLR